MPHTNRKPNAGKSSPGPDKASPFVNLPWGKEQDDELDAWIETKHKKVNYPALLDALVLTGVSVTFSNKDGQVCCLLRKNPYSEADEKYMLSGWSDSFDDALLVTAYKWLEVMGADWSHPTDSVARSRRR